MAYRIDAWEPRGAWIPGLETRFRALPYEVAGLKTGMVLGELGMRDGLRSECLNVYSVEEPAGKKEKVPREELVVSLPGSLAVFDPKTGKQLWLSKGLGGTIYASPLSLKIRLSP